MLVDVMDASNELLRELEFRVLVIVRRVCCDIQANLINSIL